MREKNVNIVANFQGDLGQFLANLVIFEKKLGKQIICTIPLAIFAENVSSFGIKMKPGEQKMWT